jgi:hypothetical protein
MTDEYGHFFIWAYIEDPTGRWEAKELVGHGMNRLSIDGINYERKVSAGDVERFYGPD